MLSHANVSSNITSAYELLDISPKDCFLGVLPFFHSFGFMATLWLPLLSGAGAVYHGNPLQAGVIGELAQKFKTTILAATPTFLLAYIKKCEKEQFASLRNVFVGAEKLRESVQQAFREKFGIVPKEGYGCTELSPLAIGNIDDFSENGDEQIGHKLGTAGHPVPGVAVRIVNPDTFEMLTPGEEGLLLVKGANVMMGYLGDKKKTDEVIKDGWYVTGDIASMDDDGFITINDRLARFSKIAGEMVPHIRLEEEIQRILGELDTVCAVTGVPDEQKGEKLVVLYTKEMAVGDIVKKLAESGLPNLWIPRKENFYQVESIPILGTGKLDLKVVKKMAEERAVILH